jgi:crossover junction endodeoxyribonuclease RusA
VSGALSPRNLRNAWQIEPPQSIVRDEDGGRLAQLTIALPYPPSLNKYWRHLPNGRTLISEHGRIYMRHINAIATLHRLKGSFPDQRLAVSLDLIMPDRLRRDVDNVPKCIFDALSKSCVWGDDSQVDEMHVYRKGVSPPGFVLISIGVIS